MAKLAYTVTATLPDEATTSAYVAWLLDGHIQGVVEGGAETAEVSRLTEPAKPIRVESRYVFSDRRAYERYVAETAPRLRAEGIKKFGPQTGVTFERRIGEIAAAHPEK